MNKILFYACCFFLTVNFSCGKKNALPRSLPVLGVAGHVTVMLPANQRLEASRGMALSEGSQVSVAAGSKIIIGIGPARCLYAHENTTFSLDSIVGPEPRLVLEISEGKIFSTIRAHLKAGALRVRMSDGNSALTLMTDKEGANAVIKTIGGAVTAEFSDAKRSVIPACCKTLVRESAAASEPLPLTTKDFEEIVSFLGKTVADSLIDNALCPQTLQNEQNQPPQWEKAPRGECPANKEFIDTLCAKDPEGAAVTYKLIEGPAGMIIDTVSGIIRFFPNRIATHPVRIAAVDPSNISAQMTYDLVVSAPSGNPAQAAVHATLNLPGTAFPGESVRIDASHSARSKDRMKRLLFRFDVNGDGAWEYPPTGAFGPQPTVAHLFPKEGVYLVRVQVKDPGGRITAARNRIVVHKKPVAKIAVSPQTPYVKTSCTFDASPSVTGCSPAAFQVRWDLDNNGTWDFPETGGYTSEKTVKKTWPEQGSFAVVLEIKDCFGALSWASAEVAVVPAAAPPQPSPAPARVNKPPIVKAGGIYQTQVNAPVVFHGEAHDPDNKIRRFFWDFHGDGVFDTSAPTGTAAYVYNKPGTCKAVLKVVSDDSSEGFDTAAVLIRNAPPAAHAGKDVLSRKGRTVALKGCGEDPDGRIALYEWDFDNNGTFDWSSPANGEVRHAFNEYAFAILRVTDEYGAAATDTLRVVICPEGMTGVESGPFCIDNYEWPNKRRTEPLRGVSMTQARDTCLAAGKRLCLGKEWIAACAGERNVQFPKSNSPQTQNCNVVGNRFFANRIAPSGSFPDCRSPAGVFDMNGNVDEWTEDTFGDSAFVYGGSWHHDIQNAQCSSKMPLLKNKGYFYVGFRCCK